MQVFYFLPIPFYGMHRKNVGLDYGQGISMMSNSRNHLSKIKFRNMHIRKYTMVLLTDTKLKSEKSSDLVNVVALTLDNPEMLDLNPSKK